jgi:hypothetical protein
MTASHVGRRVILLASCFRNTPSSLNNALHSQRVLSYVSKLQQPCILVEGTTRAWYSPEPASIVPAGLLERSSARLLLARRAQHKNIAAGDRPRVIPRPLRTRRQKGN